MIQMSGAYEFAFSLIFVPLSVIVSPFFALE